MGFGKHLVFVYTDLWGSVRSQLCLLAKPGQKPEGVGIRISARNRLTGGSLRAVRLLA